MNELINKLKDFKEIKIELIGSWLWITGNTFNIKDNLKELGFFYSKNKKAWFYNNSNKKKGIGFYKDLDEIKKRYISKEIELKEVI